jgi:hypothetical protein
MALAPVARSHLRLTGSFSPTSVLYPQLVASTSPDVMRHCWYDEAKSVPPTFFAVATDEGRDYDAFPTSWNIRKWLIPEGAAVSPRCSCTNDDTVSLLRCNRDLSAAAAASHAGLAGGEALFALQQQQQLEQKPPKFVCKACERLCPLPLCIALCSGTCGMTAAGRHAVMVVAQSHLLDLLQPSPRKPFLLGSPSQLRTRGGGLAAAPLLRPAPPSVQGRGRSQNRVPPAAGFFWSGDEAASGVVAHETDVWSGTTEETQTAPTLKPAFVPLVVPRETTTVAAGVCLSWEAAGLGYPVLPAVAAAAAAAAKGSACRALWCAPPQPQPPAVAEEAQVGLCGQRYDWHHHGSGAARASPHQVPGLHLGGALLPRRGAAAEPASALDDSRDASGSFLRRFPL